MSKILITGGGGFIGSHICLTLLEKNYNIIEKKRDIKNFLAKKSLR